jgi:hypothetical protein
VSPSTTREDPKNMLETKIVFESSVQYLDRHYDKGPALLANFTPGTTRADRVIGVHINIEAEFF